MSTTELAVGSTLWYFDHNYRVYEKNEEGRSFGGPIWREHWRPTKIEGETRLSWVTNRGKVNKKELAQGILHQWCASEEYIDKRAWVEENRWQMVRLIERLYDYEKLRKIADVIGYNVTGRTS